MKFRKKKVLNVASLYDDGVTDADNPTSQRRWIYLEGVQRSTVDNSILVMLADVWQKKPVQRCDQATLINDKYVRCVKDINSSGLHLATYVSDSKKLAIQWGNVSEGPTRTPLDK